MYRYWKSRFWQEKILLYYLEEKKALCIFKNPLYVDGVAYPHHNGKFGLNEEYFINGVKFLYSGC